MATLEEKYNKLRENTVDLFFEKLQKRVNYYNTHKDDIGESHYYKGSVKVLEHDSSSFTISFNLLPHKIVLEYSIDLNTDINISVHKHVFDSGTYPELKQVTFLNFQISRLPDGNNYHHVKFDVKEYSLRDQYNDFIDLFITRVVREFFPGDSL